MADVPRALTYDDFWRFRIVQDVQVAPDGVRAAYVVATLDRDTDEQRSAVWVVDLESGEERQFTAGLKRDAQPRWSPDGRWLAFVSTRQEDKSQIYVMGADGGEARLVTACTDGAHTPVWSPDSERIAFLVSMKSERQSVPAEVAWTGEKEERKDKPALRRITEVRYRFDAAGYADTLTHLFVVDREGGEATQLTDGDFPDLSPAWSPDGRSIAFVSNRTPDRDRNFAEDVWLVDVETRELTRLTDGSLTLSQPSWSPDGRRIAFVGEPEWIANGTENTHLRCVTREGGDQRDLMPSFDGTMGALLGDHLSHALTTPIWSPDGRTIYCTVSSHGSEALCRVPADGGEVALLTEENVHVTSAGLSPDGRELICCLATPTAPFDLYRLPAHGGELRQITHANRDLLDEVQIAPVERFTYPSVDGWQIEGWLVRPIGPVEEAPLVLHIHGGPHGMYGTTFYYNMQVLAGAGIASCYINPRGSSGYGIEFTRAVVADWGGKDYEDLMNGIDHVVASGGIDGERLAATGGSYGGFMTSWIAGHTDRFACGVVINPVTNLISFWGTSDIGALWSQKQQGGSLFERWDHYRDHSPLTYAPNIHTPLLLLHAENDFRCPIEQSEQLFVALKMLGREVELIRIPTASHGLATTALPRHRVRRWELAKAWFDRYLVSKRVAAPVGRP